MLLEQLAKKPFLNINFHSHGQTGSKLDRSYMSRFWRALLSEGFSDSVGLADRLMKSEVDILYITNFSDSRLEDWTSEEQLKKLRKAGYKVEQGDYYTFIEKNKIVKGFGKSQEVPTQQGHFLFSGIKRGKRFSDKKSLDETLAEATDKELKIADHTYAKLKGQNGVMAHSKNPEQDAKKFDAFERNPNFYFPFSLADWKAIRYSRRYNKPLVADSDDHHPKDIDRAYNKIETRYLDFSSQRALRDSINDAVRNNRFSYTYRPIPPWRIFHHFLMLVLNKLYHFYK